MEEDSSAFLSDFDVTIDSNLNDVCGAWQQNLTSIDLQSIDVTSAFSALTEFGIMTSYISSLNVALGKVSSLANSINGFVESMVEEQFGIDSDGLSDDKGLVAGGDDVGLNGESSQFVNDENGGLSGAGGGQFSSGGANFDFGDTTVDNSNANLEINSTVSDTINCLDFRDFGLLMKCLTEMAKDGEPLNKYLDDYSSGSYLKKYLLENANVSSSLKTVIADMNPMLLQQELKAFFTNGETFDDFTKDVVYEHVKEIADFKGITTDELLNGSGAVDFLNDANEVSSVIDKIAISENPQENLLNIYDGNNIEDVNESSVSMIRNIIDKIAEEKDMSTEELLTNSAKRGIVETNLENVSRIYSFVKTLGTMDRNSFLQAMEGVLS